MEYVAKAGFDAWDFSMFSMCYHDREQDVYIANDNPLGRDNYLQFARRLRQIGLDNGIVCNQSHAPFPSKSPTMRKFLKRAIECTAEAGGGICIIHPCNNWSPWENAELYGDLLPFAKEHHVKIACENMWNWNREKEESCFAACATSESFLAHLEAVHDEDLVACLDIGHAEMRPSGGGAVAMIKALGHHLQALHIHDNDLKRDSHALPFTMGIDFQSVCQALKEIGYSGDLTLEADRALADYTPDNVLDGLKTMAAAANKLRDFFG